MDLSGNSYMCGRGQVLSIRRAISIRLILLVLTGIVLSGCIERAGGRKGCDITISDTVFLRHVCDSVYVHVTRDSIGPYGWFSSNGMVVVKQGRAVLVDTPMDDKKTETLVTFLRDSMRLFVDRVIVSHFHDDCLGGLNYINNSGIPSFCEKRTAAICLDSGLPLCTHVFIDSPQISFYGLDIVCRFFGAGHTCDNIVTWVPQAKVLFGGCLVRAAESGGLGNMSDACIDVWDGTVQRLKAAYPDVKIVIPGHGMYGGPELLDHTMGLVKEKKIFRKR